MARVDEIAPDVYRICTYAKSFNLQFCQFLVDDDEPLLYHAGMSRMFEGVRDAVATVIDPKTVRWIAFSHFEADECGALNDWLEVAPDAEAMCGVCGAEVSVSDFANRPPRALADGETFSTGSRRWRFINTPQVPHAWDAGHLFEETQRTLFCSDLLNHEGDVAPLTEDDVVGPMCEMLVGYDGTPFADYFPYTAKTEAHLRRLADLEPELCATMHGSSYWGDGRGAIEEMAQMLRETLRPQPD